MNEIFYNFMDTNARHDADSSTPIPCYQIQLLAREPFIMAGFCDFPQVSPGI
jgi:hypothetical protein